MRCGTPVRAWRTRWHPVVEQRYPALLAVRPWQQQMQPRRLAEREPAQGPQGHQEFVQSRGGCHQTGGSLLPHQCVPCDCRARRSRTGRRGRPLDSHPRQRPACCWMRVPQLLRPSLRPQWRPLLLASLRLPTPRQRSRHHVSCGAQFLRGRAPQLVGRPQRQLHEHALIVLHSLPRRPQALQAPLWLEAPRRAQAASCDSHRLPAWLRASLQDLRSQAGASVSELLARGNQEKGGGAEDEAG